MQIRSNGYSGLPIINNVSVHFCDRQIGNLPRFCLGFHTKSAGIGSSFPLTLMDNIDHIKEILVASVVKF